MNLQDYINTEYEMGRTDVYTEFRMETPWKEYKLNADPYSVIVSFEEKEDIQLMIDSDFGIFERVYKNDTITSEFINKCFIEFVSDFYSDRKQGTIMVPYNKGNIWGGDVHSSTRNYCLTVLYCPIIGFPFDVLIHDEKVTFTCTWADITNLL